MLLVITLIVLLIIHALYNYALTMLTIPKINDVSKKRKIKYEEIQTLLNQENTSRL
jgi:hypothetical protein